MKQYKVFPLVFALILLTLCWAQAETEGKALVDVKVTYADGIVIEKKALTGDQTLQLLTDLVESGKDGFYEITGEKGEKLVRFDVVGDVVRSANGKAMTRRMFLTEVASKPGPAE